MAAESTAGTYRRTRRPLRIRNYSRTKARANNNDADSIADAADDVVDRDDVAAAADDTAVVGVAGAADKDAGYYRARTSWSPGRR